MCCLPWVNTSSKKIGYGVSCKMIHGKFLLRIMVKRKFSFNLTLTSDRKTWFDEPWQKFQVHKTYANCSPHKAFYARQGTFPTVCNVL